MQPWSQLIGGRQERPRAFCYVLCLVGILLPAIWAVASSPDATSGHMPVIDALSRGRHVAEVLVRQSPTFRFDGIEESIQVEAVRPLEACPACYEYTLYFETRHPGYGNRQGLGITRELTPHRARIVLKQNRVVTAILDNSWDIATQQIVDFE
jgi:hypothetical protein